MAKFMREGGHEKRNLRKKI